MMPSWPRPFSSVLIRKCRPIAESALPAHRSRVAPPRYGGAERGWRYYLDKRIRKLRDEISESAATFPRVGRLLVFQPERPVFEGQAIAEQFAGKAVISRKAMDVDSLLAEVRATITRKKASTDELVELGIDLEEAEREQNLRAGRSFSSGQRSLPNRRRPTGTTGQAGRSGFH
jgi:hypothetical protein